MSFQVGDKVVCVDAKGVVDAFPLVEGRVYVVRDLSICQITEKLGLYLVGIVNPLCWNGREFCYKAYRFRKLSEMQQEARERRSVGLQRGVSKPGSVSVPDEVSEALPAGCFPKEGGAA